MEVDSRKNMGCRHRHVVLLMWRDLFASETKLWTKTCGDLTLHAALLSNSIAHADSGGLEVEGLANTGYVLLVN